MAWSTIEQYRQLNWTEAWRSFNVRLQRTWSSQTKSSWNLKRKPPLRFRQVKQTLLSATSEKGDVILQFCYKTRVIRMFLSTAPMS